jgi:hypothetical protein
MYILNFLIKSSIKFIIFLQIPAKNKAPGFPRACLIYCAAGVVPADAGCVFVSGVLFASV